MGSAMLHDFELYQDRRGLEDWPQTSIEAARQMRAVLEMLARLANGVGMPETADLLLHTADAADTESRLTPVNRRQN